MSDAIERLQQDVRQAVHRARSNGVGEDDIELVLQEVAQQRRREFHENG